jgi:hypothetical protein
MVALESKAINMEDITNVRGHEVLSCLSSSFRWSLEQGMTSLVEPAVFFTQSVSVSSSLTRCTTATTQLMPHDLSSSDTHYPSSSSSIVINKQEKCTREASEGHLPADAAESITETGHRVDISNTVHSTQYNTGQHLYQPLSSKALRGLMATRDIRPGDYVITVPLSMIVSYDYILASDFVSV